MVDAIRTRVEHMVDTSRASAPASVGHSVRMAVAPTPAPLVYTRRMSIRAATVACVVSSFALVGCPRQDPAAQTPDARAPVPSGPSTPSGPSANTIPCQKDSDCGSPVCGPCISGEELQSNGPSCAVNPCPNKPVACSPKKTCIIK
jgi:hypothetical protein